MGTKLIAGLVPILFVAGCATNAFDQDSELEANPIRIPSFEAAVDAQSVEDVDLNMRCEAASEKTFPGIRLHEPVITDSEAYGRVWRTKATVILSGREGVIVCWDPPEDKAQRVLLNSKFTD